MKKLSPSQLSNTSLLSSSELNEVNRRVNLEINELHIKLRKIGGVANFLSGTIVVFILHKHVSLPLLLYWYVALVLVNLLNIGLSAIYKKESPKYTPKKIALWNKIFYFILIVLCSIWGSMYILFASQNGLYQLYITAFLLAVLLGFGSGAITDFKVAIIAAIFMLAPYAIFRIYLGINYLSAGLEDPSLNLGFGLCMLVFGAFMLSACYMGSKLLRKFFHLTFANIMLSEKLESANRLLEHRVKERTIELEKSLELVKYQATHDLLTHLPNERLLEECIESEIKLAEQNNYMFAIFFVGLNEMDKINDGLGHQASALTVQIIAKRLKNFFNKNENSRLTNFKFTLSLSRRDEFVILLNPLFELDTIEAMVFPIFSILEEPIYINDRAIKLTASIGVSIYPKDGQDVRSLLMNADAAMRFAKQWGGNKVNIYKAEINARLSKQLEIESHLHNALKNHEFTLYYQPFIDLKTGQICGMEALLRWKSPELGFVSPVDFIPLAEANGIILPLGEWVLHNACLQTKIWHARGFNSLKVAINLSAKQLQQKNIVEVITHILKETNLAPQYIELELTETEAFKEEAIPIIKQFKLMGIGLSIDDFGTGYSGLTNLKLFTISKLKIDKSFIQDIDISGDSRAIVSNTIGLAKKMGITVLAEGVETKEQLKFLLENYCDMIQGYYFSPPLPPDDFTNLLISKPNLLLDF